MKEAFLILFEALKSAFGFAAQSSENKGAKIPLQENAIREDANTKAIRELRKQDRIQDKDLLREPKILYHFDTVYEMMDSVNLRDNLRPLYYGSKSTILYDIKHDPAKILTLKQQRQFKKLVKKSEKDYFVIKIHPLTIHQ